MLHADDLLAPTGLETVLTAIAGAPAETVLIAGRHRTFSSPDHLSHPRPRWPFRTLIDGGDFAARVLPFHCPLTPFTAMRRDAYIDAGGLDPRWQLVQDWELWMRLAQRGDLLNVPGEVGRWRIHPTSDSYRELNASEHENLAEALPEIVPDVPSPVARRARQIQRARAALQRSREGADLRDATRRHRRANAEVALRLYVLRFIGLFRLAFRR
jgi:hypothetical protein